MSWKHLEYGTENGTKIIDQNMAQFAQGRNENESKTFELKQLG